MGLPRDAPTIILDFEKLKNRPQRLEKEPAWCSQVPSLDQTFSLSDVEGNFRKTRAMIKPAQNSEKNMPI